jgi:uncharacterized membrane protein (DUF485 family)
MNATALKTAYLVLLVLVLAGATIWLASAVAGEIMPGWIAAIGPVLLALAVWAHWRGRRS